MFTPEDVLDAIDHRLGELRRHLHVIDTAPSYRITDEDKIVERRVRIVTELRELEREREQERARLLDEWGDV